MGVSFLSKIGQSVLEKPIKSSAGRKPNIRAAAKLIFECQTKDRHILARQGIPPFMKWLSDKGIITLDVVEYSEASKWNWITLTKKGKFLFDYCTGDYYLKFIDGGVIPPRLEKDKEKIDRIKTLLESPILDDILNRVDMLENIVQ